MSITVRIAISIIIAIVSFIVLSFIYKHPKPLLMGSGEIHTENHRFRFGPNGMTLYCGDKTLQCISSSGGANLHLKCTFCKNTIIMAAYSLPKNAYMREWTLTDDGKWHAGDSVTTDNPNIPLDK